MHALLPTPAAAGSAQMGPEFVKTRPERQPQLSAPPGGSGRLRGRLATSFSLAITRASRELSHSICLRESLTVSMIWIPCVRKRSFSWFGP
jgi:hypothetical protein